MDETTRQRLETLATDLRECADRWRHTAAQRRQAAQAEGLGPAVVAMLQQDVAHAKGMTQAYEYSAAHVAALLGS